MRARIRMARPKDASALLEMYRPIVENTHTSFELSVPTDAEMARRTEPPAGSPAVISSLLGRGAFADALARGEKILQEREP